MAFVPFQYRAWVKKLDWTTGQLISEGAVIDGDTAWMFNDKGRREYENGPCRLWGCNAYELNDVDPGKRQKAQAGKLWLKTKIEGKQVFLISKKLDDKYGRMLVIVWTSEKDFGNNAKSVNQELITLGHATPYMGELL